MRGAVLRLKRGHEGRGRVHPWIFKGDVADVSPVAPGGVVTVVDSGGRFVGRGLFNPRPALCCRVLTYQDEPVDQAFLERRVAEAVARRRAGGPPPLGRLVWSEADGLPGFVADRYGPVLVIQCLTLGMAARRKELTAALHAAVGPLPVFAADDPGPAGMEGFDPVRGWLAEAGPERVVVEEAGVRLGVTFGVGQKTGLDLDQRDNRARVGRLGEGRDVLDAFCYSAGFACHALVAGARRVVCIESSPEAITAARENFALNGVTARAEIVADNAFDELRRLQRAGARFGLVVLDPPPFARGRETLAAAVRGYKEINLRAIRLLEPRGRLATFACSHHVSPDLFAEICRDAATDAGASLRVEAVLGQAADHPVILTIPETRYLTGLLLEAL